MNCNETKYLLSLYQSGELDAAMMAAFELHLEGCDKCARDVEDYTKTDNLLRAAFAEEELNASPLRARIMEKLPMPNRKKQFRIGYIFYMRAMAALFLLTIGGAILYLYLHNASQTVYAAAVDDHLEEVVQRVPVRGWRETRQEIENLSFKELGDSDFITRLEIPNYHLMKARICALSGKHYVHLVYQDETKEISVFISRKDGELPGSIVETASGCDLHVQATGKFEVTGVQSERFTLLIVSHLPQMESLRLARQAALLIR